jgi:hypothetical protein
MSLLRRLYFPFVQRQLKTQSIILYLGILGGLTLSLIPNGAYYAQGIGEQPYSRRAPGSPYTTPNCGCGDNETCEGSWSSDSSNAVMHYYCVNKPEPVPAATPSQPQSSLDPLAATKVLAWFYGDGVLGNIRDAGGMTPEAIRQTEDMLNNPLVSLSGTKNQRQLLKLRLGLGLWLYF